MAKKKRHTAAEIAAKLRQADALSAEGRVQNEIAKALGVSVMTFHRWRKARPQTADSAPASAPTSHLLIVDKTEAEPGRQTRIAELQLENARLRRLVTDLLLEKMKLEEDTVGLQSGTAKRAWIAGSRAF